MILEVMGRNSGWIALESGIAGGAHIILIPEIPYHLDIVLEKIRMREVGGSPYTIIVVAEAARELGGN
jgi:ATP-dependent phosphofructokinase / diphosphate-dependent phosphofructokinase